MIQLIRRFLNSENTPLNRILRTGLEELSNKIGEADGKTLFDGIGSLNSNFDKPLNELIEETKNDLTSYIDNLFVTLLAEPSENVKTALISSETITKSTSNSASYFKSYLVSGFSGSIRITATLKTHAANSSSHISIYDKDGNSYGSIVLSGTTSYTTLNKDINVNDGDILHFKFYTNNSSYNAYCNLLTIGYDITEINEKGVLIEL